MYIYIINKFKKKKKMKNEVKHVNYKQVIKVIFIL
jgi:hypothetical protein